jgi:hypothetical protein
MRARSAALIWGACRRDASALVSEALLARGSLFGGGGRRSKRKITIRKRITSRRKSKSRMLVSCA